MQLKFNLHNQRLIYILAIKWWTSLSNKFIHFSALFKYLKYLTHPYFPILPLLPTLPTLLSSAVSNHPSNGWPTKVQKFGLSAMKIYPFNCCPCCGCGRCYFRFYFYYCCCCRCSYCVFIIIIFVCLNVVVVVVGLLFVFVLVVVVVVRLLALHWCPTSLCNANYSIYLCSHQPSYTCHTYCITIDDRNIVAGMSRWMWSGGGRTRRSRIIGWPLHL